MRWLKSLINAQKAKDIELAAEMITHLRDGTLDKKAVASVLAQLVSMDNQRFSSVSSSIINLSSTADSSNLS